MDRRLQDYDFDYIFYEEDKMKYLDICIDATTSILNENRSEIFSQVNNLGIAFTL